MTETPTMAPQERRAVTGLALVFSTRLFGLFLILPVFAVYARGLEGYTPFLGGLAIGIYGLTQGLLQIPFGMLSDRVGRIPIIHAGLGIFFVGSVVAAMADTMAGVVLGRVLQGGGAIAGSVIALVADSTREAVRGRAMAIVGMTIGASFLLSLIGGPLLGSWIGVRGIFWLTAGLALGGMLVTAMVIPRQRPSSARLASADGSGFLEILRDPAMRRLNGGIFILHAALTALFVVMPLMLADRIHVPVNDHWMIYTLVMLLSVLPLMPLMRRADRPTGSGGVFRVAVIAVCLSQFWLWMAPPALWAVFAGLLLFFSGFNVLEATLPAEISRRAPGSARGAAMGVFATAQFLGAFSGGALGGFIHGRAGLEAVFLLNSGAALVWLALLKMPEVRPVTVK